MQGEITLSPTGRCVLARALIAACAALALLAEPTFAAPGDPPAAAAPQEGGAKRFRPPGPDRSRDVDFLLGALKAAPSPEAARALEQRILSLWLASGSDTADLLMTRVKTATDAKDIDLAIQLLDAVVEIKPDYAEGWNRRATLHFLKKDLGRSLDDLRQTLAREPRHFAAWAGLGMILQEIGEEKPALEALRRALDINPHLPRLPEAVKSLSEKVEGRDI